MLFIAYISMLALGHGDKLPSGQHNFPFQFMLPPTLPSSFEHQYGQVRYLLKATLDKPLKFYHHTKLPFTVVSLLDLNAIPEASRPMQNQVAKTLCCLCCESGPITGVLRVDKSGYVPGEAIYLQGEIQNLSDTACSVEVKLNLLHVNPSSVSTRLVVPVDIIIGSIPLRSSFQSIMQPQPAIAPHAININVKGQGPGAFPSAPELRLVI
ncbi:arrestin domain-containing protein 17-like [Mytilus californianus]|uniref:arrestin domain-containing protein 17-like n=1 Tax=Mytilus californianus TaxID=6549 RepID=UPI0022477BFD|nr:arrestin domain-containing protein 17-like [Mytilus californianus]